MGGSSAGERELRLGDLRVVTPIINFQRWSGKAWRVTYQRTTPSDNPRRFPFTFPPSPLASKNYPLHANNPSKSPTPSSSDIFCFQGPASLLRSHLRFYNKNQTNKATREHIFSDSVFGLVIGSFEIPFLVRYVQLPFWRSFP